MSARVGRAGTKDTDTCLTVVANLAAALEIPAKRSEADRVCLHIPDEPEEFAYEPAIGALRTVNRRSETTRAPPAFPAFIGGGHASILGEILTLGRDYSYIRRHTGLPAPQLID